MFICGVSYRAQQISIHLFTHTWLRENSGLSLNYSAESSKPGCATLLALLSSSDGVTAAGPSWL